MDGDEQPADEIASPAEHCEASEHPPASRGGRGTSSASRSGSGSGNGTAADHRSPGAGHAVSVAATLLSPSVKSTPSSPSATGSDCGLLHQPDRDFGFWRQWRTSDEIREFFGEKYDRNIELKFQWFIETHKSASLEDSATAMATNVRHAFGTDGEIGAGLAQLEADKTRAADKLVYLTINYWKLYGKDRDLKSKVDFFRRFLRPEVPRTVAPSLVASFWNPNHQNNRSLDRFYEFLKDVKRTRGKEAGGAGEHYVPFVVLFQTSGSGKSFLVKSVAQKGIYVAYLNARRVGTGYPGLSPLFASDSITKHLNENAQLTFTCFIQAALESIIACTAYGIEPTLFTRWMADPLFGHAEDVWEWLLRRIEEIWGEQKHLSDWEIIAGNAVLQCTSLLTCLNTDKSAVDYSEDSTNGVVTFNGFGVSTAQTVTGPPPSVFGMQASDTQGSLLNISFTPRENLPAVDTGIERSEKPVSDAPLVLFAMDELSSLPEDQRLNWRRACCILPKSIVCLPTMMDTVSTVSVLAPEKINDPSARMRDSKMDMIIPFYWLSIFSNTVDKGGDDGIDLTRLSTSYDLDCIGRPLWAAYTNVDYRRDVAVQKLMGKGTGAEASGDGNLALLSCRFPLEINSFDLTNNMVGHHLRYCQYLSGDRSAIMSAYASEPILARVSSLITLEDEKFEACLRTIALHVRSGAVSVGDRGETAAAILVQRAFDIAAEKSKQRIAPRIPFLTYPFADVDHFMSTLLPDALFSDLQFAVNEVAARTHCPSVLRGRCFFNHFIQLYEKPGKALLVELAARCAAAFARRNEFGFDLLVPVIMPDDTDGRYIIAEKNMSFIVFQVKNREGGDGDFKQSSVAKLASHKIGLDTAPAHTYISVYMSLSTRWKVSPKNWKAHHLLPELSDSGETVDTMDISSTNVADSGQPDASSTESTVNEIGNSELTEDQRDTQIYQTMAQNNGGLNVQIGGVLNELESRKLALNAWNRHRQIAVQTFGISQNLFTFLTPQMHKYIGMIAQPVKNPAAMPDSTQLQRPFIEETYFPAYVQRAADESNQQVLPSKSRRSRSAANKKLPAIVGGSSSPADTGNKKKSAMSSNGTQLDSGDNPKRTSGRHIGGDHRPKKAKTGNIAAAPADQ